MCFVVGIMWDLVSEGGSQFGCAKQKRRSLISGPEVGVVESTDFSLQQHH